ncbi:hypothetical protein SAMN05192549_1101 [Duganella sacchari]|uniref:Uncharacterized protein n=1 Tax=Duganella sacchari TaxID=551987 RepID=A0A1M7R3R4_9BURK|nr:hypothetical protein [Duganella sacchari]SHN39480.1 hypothetical protein SAMN05192549_1101 [Duganella sacchari]
MFTTMSVQLPTHILLDQKQLSTTMDPGSPRGYQWKCLFLPEGTVLRSRTYGEHNSERRKWRLRLEDIAFVTSPGIG